MRGRIGKDRKGGLGVKRAAWGRDHGAWAIGAWPGHGMAGGRENRRLYALERLAAIAICGNVRGRINASHGDRITYGCNSSLRELWQLLQSRKGIGSLLWV